MTEEDAFAQPRDAHDAARGVRRKDQLPVEETERLIASDKVEGTAVFDRAGRAVGTVRSIMLDKVTGKAAYAVIVLAGREADEERFHPVPWPVLRYDTARSGYVLETDVERVERGPSFRAAEPWPGHAQRNNLYEHYGVGKER